MELQTKNTDSIERNEILPIKGKTIIFFASILLPVFLIYLIGFLIAILNKEPLQINIPALIEVFFVGCFYTTLLYCVAGGFTWENKKLSTFRIVLFFIFGDLLISLLFYGIWYLVRVIYAKLYNYPISIVMGGLLLRKQKVISYSPSEEQSENNEEITCEHCGTKTKIGSYYSFVYGYKTGTRTESIPGGQRFKTFYNTHDSRKYYFCNKCVILRSARKLAKTYKIVLTLLSGLLVAMIIVDLIDFKAAFAFPLFIIAFVGTMAFYQRYKLQIMEKASFEDYSNIHNNPRYTNKLYEGKIVKDMVKEQGEKLAIDMKTETGASIYYSHSEAFERLMVEMNFKE